MLSHHCAKQHDEEEEHEKGFDDEAAVTLHRLSVLEDLRVALLHVNRRLLRTQRLGACGPTGGASRCRQRRASVFASIRSMVSPCSATTDVKRWNMPPSSARVDFIAVSSSSRCCRERGVQKCCCCCCCCCGGGCSCCTRADAAAIRWLGGCCGTTLPGRCSAPTPGRSGCGKLPPGKPTLIAPGIPCCIPCRIPCCMPPPCMPPCMPPPICMPPCMPPPCIMPFCMPPWPGMPPPCIPRPCISSAFTRRPPMLSSSRLCQTCSSSASFHPHRLQTRDSIYLEE